MCETRRPPARGPLRLEPEAPAGKRECRRCGLLGYSLPIGLLARYQRTKAASTPAIRGHAPHRPLGAAGRRLFRTFRPCRRGRRSGEVPKVAGRLSPDARRKSASGATDGEPSGPAPHPARRRRGLQQNGTLLSIRQLQYRNRRVVFRSLLAVQIRLISEPNSLFYGGRIFDLTD